MTIVRNTVDIDQTRLDRVMATPLKSGSHKSMAHGACVMEAVSYIAREPWSDHPECACPVIATFLRSWNDGLPDAERTDLLRDLIPMVVGTRSTKAVENRRATMAADWLIRTYTPAWLRLAGLTAQADSLASLPEITDFAQCPGLMSTLNAVRSDASAAWKGAKWNGATRAATRAAAWDASGNAAWAASGNAAWDAAWATAWATAWAAAGAAAGDALASTKRELQQSARDLVIRMCAIEAVEVQS